MACCSIDFDDEVSEWLAEVRPKAKRTRDHNLKYQRLHEERAIKKKLKQREAAKKAYQRDQTRSGPVGCSVDSLSFPTNKSLQQMSADAMPEGMADIFGDPELANLLQDPEVGWK